MSKWLEIYKKKLITNDESYNNSDIKDIAIKAEPNTSHACIKNDEQERQSLQPENKPREKDEDINSGVNTEIANEIDPEISSAETYYPTTTDKAWKLAESFLTKQSTVTKKKLLLTIARKYKDTPNADFIRFYNDNDVLLIENVPSLEAGVSCSNEAKPANAVQVAYFVRDFKTKELYFPKTLHEAWTLVKKLLPKELVERATR